MPSFVQTRSTRIAAPSAAVRAFVADFHAWTKWSPWEALDANMQRTYAGASEGEGARYAWAGKKAGEGSMVITRATPDTIEIDLDFLKPFPAKNKVVFRFEAEGSDTRVTWTMSGRRNLLLAILGALFFDRMIGKDFDKGLAKLKAAAEGLGAGVFRFAAQPELPALVDPGRSASAPRAAALVGAWSRDQAFVSSGGVASGSGRLAPGRASPGSSGHLASSVNDVIESEP